MRIKSGKVFKYEMMNILRNRWVFAYTLLVGLMGFALIRIGGDFQKAIVSLSGITVVLVPLISALFTTLYWYYNERFTELMLTQPIPRRTLFWTRFLALTSSLSVCYAIGVLSAFMIFGELNFSVLLLIVIATLLTFIFVAGASLISILVVDRMKGMGLVFGFWLYLVLIHDAVILMMLLLLSEYPMDLPGALMGALSPIGLARVVLLMYNESSLLLGHTGALIRNILTGWQGYAIAAGFFFMWMAIPLAWGRRTFNKKDF